MYVDNYIDICYAIENNLHKQQCIIGLARKCKYNALLNFMYYIEYLQALMNLGYAHTM